MLGGGSRRSMQPLPSSDPMQSSRGAQKLHELAAFFRGIGHSRGVGHIYASVKVSREPEGPSQEVSLLVDTGATASVIPGDVLASLEVTPLRTEEFELADGRKIPRQVGGAYLTFSDRTAPTLVVFGEPGDAPVLGVMALEELGLEIDSRSGEIRRSKRLLVATRRTPGQRPRKHRATLVGT